MPKLNSFTDEYILKSADFAKPILEHFRQLVHKACPEVIETKKWSFPHFDYAGGILCSMAAFTQHCSVGFWLGSKLKDPNKILHIGSEKVAMGHLGPIKTLKDLPPDKILSAYIKEAMSLNEQGVKMEKAPKTPLAEIIVPEFFSNYLKKNKAARQTFDNFSPSHKKEYIQWIVEAKTEATREKRMEQAVEMLAEGKSRNWKYQR